MQDGERSLAVFIDFENLALGFQNRRDRFNIERVLERLVEKGKIVAKKAYADWSRFSAYTAPLHEAAIELVEIPRRAQSGKNSADIRLCVDAMDLAYSKEHIDTFVILSGDSDFSPLVSKLKENGKHVIGLGMQESTSDLLRDNCDEFIYYEDLGKAPTLAPDLSTQLPENKRKAFALLLESLLALRRENKEVLWSSMIKDTMKRKKPSFNEAYHGYRTFSELLEDAQKEGLLELETDKRSRTYVVTRFGSEMNTPAPTAAPSRKKGRRRRSSKKGRLAGRTNGEQPVLGQAPPATPPASELIEATEAIETAEVETPSPPETIRDLYEEADVQAEPLPRAESADEEDSQEEEVAREQHERRGRQSRRSRGRHSGRQGKAEGSAQPEHHSEDQAERSADTARPPAPPTRNKASSAEASEEEADY